MVDRRGRASRDALNTRAHALTALPPHHHRPPPLPPPPPKKTNEQVNEGVVVAVGPGRHTRDGALMPVSVKEGDKVLLPEYGGAMVKMDNKE